MEQTVQIINRVLPILLLIFLGSWIRRQNFLRESTIDDLRKLVVNLALPAVLFVSFLGIDLKPAYLVVFGIIFSLCLLLLGLGQWLKQRFHVPYLYFPFLTTGFEYGMLGVSLFGSAYSLEKIGYIAIVDLGHEIFIWFVFLPLLLMKRDGAQNLRGVAKSFLTSPVVLAIVAGIGLNLAGLRELLPKLPLTGGVMLTLQSLAGLTIPLILIIVGYGIKFDRRGLTEAFGLVALRLGLLTPLALALNFLVIRQLLGLEKFFEMALFTLLILPPPFIVPLYARQDIGDEKRYINNVLTLHTVISIALYVVYFVLNPGG
jgi:malate permease and related proteins